MRSARVIAAFFGSKRPRKQIVRLSAEGVVEAVLSISSEDSAALLDRAYAAQRQGDHQTALAAFEAACTADPTHPGLKASAAAALRALGRLDEAEGLLRQALAIEPQHVPSLAELGYVARCRGDHAAALTAFEAATAADPRHVGLKAALAAALRELGRLDEAEAVVRQALAIEPQHAGLLAELGYSARRRGDHAAALNAFEAATAADPGHAGLRAAAAAALRELGRLGEAELALRQALAIEPRHAGILAELGYIARTRGDHAAALKAFEAASALDPAHVGLKAAAASTLRELERFDDAERLLREILSIEPRHAGSLAELGYIARRRGDHVAALEAFEAAAAADPGHAGLKTAAASELRELNRFDEAEAWLRQALAIEPHHPGALAELGYVARRRGDHEAALAALQAAAAADPAHAGLKASAAATLRELGRFDEAESLSREALAIEPHHAGALAELGYIARMRGDRAAALSAFEAATAADPTHVGLKAAAALELQELGRFEEAEAWLRQTLAIEPRHLPSLLGLGHIARRRGDRAAALAAYESAAAAHPREIGTALEIVNSLRDLGQFGAAEEEFVQLLAGDPDHAAALIGLGSIRLEQFRLDQAEQLFRRAAAAAPHEPAALLCLGYLARRRGDFEDALAQFAAARAADPSSIGAALETAAALRELGRFADAHEIIGGILKTNPQHHAATLQLGYLLRREGERDKALAQFTLAHRQQPQQPQPLVEMAIEARVLGKPRDSEALLRRALALYPDYLAALEQLAEHHLLAEEFDAALAVARGAIAAYPHRHSPYLAAARAAFEQGDRAEAHALLDQAEALAGHVPEIRAVRAHFFMQQRDWDAAYALLSDPAAETARHVALWTALARLAVTTGDYETAEAALPVFPTTVHEASRAELYRGQIAEARWNLGQAAAHYRKAAALDPGDAGAHFELARVALKLLDLDACRRHLSRQIELNASSLRLRGQSLNPSQTHVGQILDEFALDAAQLDALRRVRLLPIEQQIGALQEMAVRDPDHTPTAMMLMMAMRQAGRFIRIGGRAPDGNLDYIPRRIVQYWDEAEPPPEIAALMATWREAHPHFDYVRLDADSAGEFLAAAGMDDVLAAYRRAREPAQQADLVRLAYLAARGGIYADADDRCLAAVGSYLPPDARFVTYQEDYGTLGNNFIAVVPGHPVIRLALKLAATAVNRGDNDLLWLSTGPGALTRAYAQIAARAAAGSFAPVDTVVLDLGFIARRIGFHCPVLYKKTLRHWSRSSFGRKSRTEGRKASAA